MVTKNSHQERTVDFFAMIASAPFQQGVADWLVGAWNPPAGRWGEFFSAEAVYETGRLASAAIGRPCRNFTDYMQACDVRAFPPNAPRVEVSAASSDNRLIEQFYAGLGRKLRR